MSAYQLAAAQELQHQVCVLVHLIFNAALKMPAPPLWDLEFVSKILNAQEPQSVDIVQALLRYNAVFKIQLQLLVLRDLTFLTCYQLQTLNALKMQAIHT